MGDVVGLHQGIQYEATYHQQGGSAARLARGNELMFAKGMVTTTGDDCLDVSLLVHLAVQHEINNPSQSIAVSGNQSRHYASGENKRAAPYGRRPKVPGSETEK